MKKLVIIDGYSLFFRAYFATAYTGNFMQTSKGTPTNAIFAFSNMMFRILQEHNFTHLMIALDPGGKTFRHDLYPEYKGTRSETPDEMIPQFGLLPELLDALNIKHYKKAGYEADDLIGTIAAKAEKDGYEVAILTSDRDMLQLIDDNTTVRLLKKGLSEIEDMHYDELMEQQGIEPHQVPDMKGLMGDSADNIPGVPGIGPKTAEKLLAKYKTIDGVYEHLEDLKGKQKENLENNKEQAYLSRDLATIRCGVDFDDFSLDELAYNSIDLHQSQQFFREIESNTLVKKSQEIYDMQTTTTLIEESQGLDTLLDGIEDLIPPRELVDQSEKLSLPQEAVLYMEHPYENYHEYPAPLFVVIKTEAEEYVFDWENFIGNASVLQWLADSDAKKIVFDSKKIYAFMLHANVPVSGIIFDVQLANYVIDPTERNDEIADCANNLGHSLRYQEHIYGKNTKFSIDDLDAILEYACESSEMTLICATELKEQLEKDDLYSLLIDVELPLSKILAKMEAEGVCVDKSVLEEQGEIISGRIDELEKTIHELAGEPFNVSSPKQLGVILFEKLGLPVIKKTKTGYSTAANVLEALEGKHPIIDYIGEYRGLSKLNSTYINGLMPMISDKGKIHTIYKQAQTQTGRLSSIEPNLQNIPIRMEEGRLIRKAFVASPKQVLLTADYSQIELRVLAELSSEEHLQTAFIENRDIHEETARKIFDLSDDEEVTPLMRSQAKTVNFGIIYGMSDFGLATQLQIPRHEAKQFIERYFELFPGIESYMNDSIKQAEATGYVETVLKRRRYFPTIHSRNFNERNFAKRAAMNAPIQGSAADILKLAMIAIDKKMFEAKMKSTMILQVHDELIFDVVADELDALKAMVYDEMIHAFEMNVPLDVGMSTGENWYNT